MKIFVLRKKLNPYRNFEGDMQFYLTFNTSSRRYCHLSVWGFKPSSQLQLPAWLIVLTYLFRVASSKHFFSVQWHASGFVVYRFGKLAERKKSSRKRRTNRTYKMGLKKKTNMIQNKKKNLSLCFWPTLGTKMLSMQRASIDSLNTRSVKSAFHRHSECHTLTTVRQK
jgi:hypothetical protein